MSINLSNHLKNEESYLSAVKTLQVQGYNLDSVYREHSLRGEKYDSRKPTEEDMRYALTTPEGWRSHFEATDKQGDFTKEPPVLGTNTARCGGQFLLTKGQRSVLRERFGLTPSKVVEIVELSMFPGTNMVDTLKLKSCIHEPEAMRRKHLLNICTITAFGAFMSMASEVDAMEDVDTWKEPKGSTKVVKVKKPELTAEQLLETYSF